ncbi:hypothetical protein LX36DRAFT_649734 [Colletotrichum falcatum]|nr:hypothetical protein LX36DRAFT_649734 [Colletotrichum falcatum]
MRFIGLLLSLLAAWYANAAKLEKRNPTVPTFLFDTIFWVERGDWKCNKAQVTQLSKAIEEARGLAQSAVTALSASKAEQSDAYRTWFGQSNASPQKKTTIINMHFLPAQRNLIPPTSKTTFNKMNEKFTNARGKGVTKDSLVYACPPPGDSYCKIPNTLALIMSQTPGSGWDGPTMMILCPAFFTSKASIDAVAKDWRASGSVKTSANPALTLIHEFQYMTRLTGQSNVCTTVPDPSSKGVDSITGKPKGCYSPECCMRLSDELKIKNAENYNMFAGFIRAWPEKAKPS